jgi:glycosyltransferase involved in cell wall biosynthesis
MPTESNRESDESCGEWRGGRAPHTAPIVTAICACLNSTATLAVQLDALAAQDCDFPWEMIVVDDGSTDGTLALARSYGDKFASLLTLDTDAPRAQAEGLNAAARVARGRYLLIVDSDDEVAPGYLSAMKAALDEHPVVGARIDDVALNPDYCRARIEPMQQIDLSVLHDFLPIAVGASLGIHRDVFDQVGGFDVTSTPLIDADLSWRLQLAGVPLAFAPEAVLRYRYRTGLRATFRQKRNYGVGDVFLAKRFQPAGMRRRGWRDGVRGWCFVLRTGLHVRDRRSATRFVDSFGGAVGRVQGSIKYRFLHL